MLPLSVRRRFSSASLAAVSPGLLWVVGRPSLSHTWPAETWALHPIPSSSRKTRGDLGQCDGEPLFGSPPATLLRPNGLHKLNADDRKRAEEHGEPLALRPVNLGCCLFSGLSCWLCARRRRGRRWRSSPLYSSKWRSAGQKRTATHFVHSGKTDSRFSRPTSGMASTKSLGKRFWTRCRPDAPH